MINRVLRRGVGLSAAAVGTCIIFDVSIDNLESAVFFAADKIVTPLMRNLLDAETAHKTAILFASYGLSPRDSSVDSKVLEQKVFGLTFPNPIGLAAGYDKDGEAVGGLLDLGFGFVEVGSVVPEPQPGNDLPRVFRLMEDKGVINRYGFNSKGVDVAETNLKKYARRSAHHRTGLLGVNAGKNKKSEGAQTLEDYCTVLTKLGPYADYLVVNVSSPNTPGLRDLQKEDALSELLRSCRIVRDEILRERKTPREREKRVMSKKGFANTLPLLVKIDPDLSPQQRQEIAALLLRHEADGVIVSNTTVSRPLSLVSGNKNEIGGLSGQPLKHKSTALIADIYQLTNGQVPIIGVGGVADGEDALMKILAGASLVQMYSMLAYEGPGAVRRTKRQLQLLLKARGYISVSEAVGRESESLREKE
mmetsp:Transcript_35590/g.36294  ORF Transcript_35590/g.36294 Transcript_35590/m.36294 type:complete len:420 (+) Transcript_35590:200-1459(+)|eukprot:CAMPEP_0182426000 /NCGR_PEP_ID=MMETSP1167-20130531/12481_1 /TAXON_ID=2988 /ORGANISM="Mallomonas Sp, Strain CCMP3275" /LENGTH=419 /DNA_ID=CAMNT_0024607125 /DNA_START=124 /DNA_END=1383 /DNA_ORIENTATION=+